MLGLVPIRGLLSLLRLLAFWLCPLLRRLLVSLLRSLLLLRRLLAFWLCSLVLLPFLILSLILIYSFLFTLVLLLPPGIASRTIVGTNRTWRAIVLGVLPTPILALLFVARTPIGAVCLLSVLLALSRTISLLIVFLTLNVPPIAALVTGGAIGWRIVNASCLSGWHAIFEVPRPRSSCDCRPAVIYGRALFTIHSR